ncbi:MAG: 4a-hydroxytetrahydrobiopterin dehydratase [Chthonomonadaceae bacterium]|nr:4a-hydroxytetrahydrobiopterin dehydratase [Chthonomonadaceae bacterium]
MLRPVLLTDTELDTALASLSGWKRESDRLLKTFVFADFVEAWAWMCRVALVAEKKDHHPEWSNVYKTVKVELTTHDARGITLLDIELAKTMNSFAQK